MMKKLEDMTLTESVDYWTGRLTLAIGAGKFRDEVCMMIGVITRESYEHGKKERMKRGKKS